MTAVFTTPTSRVLVEIAAERSRQTARWGEQNHADGTGPGVAYLDLMTVQTPAWCYLSAAELATLARHECQEAFALEGGSYRHILLEEVAEAFAEADPTLLRAELIQVAAVAVAWIEAIDRRSR